MESIKSAISSIWSNKIRSLLTVLGIVIGVSSVTILVSLGQGLKNDVSSMIRGFGSNLMFVVAGKIDTTNPQAMQQTNPANFISGEVLTEKDVQVVSKIDGVEAISPMALVPGNLKYKDKVASPVLTGVYPSFKDALEIVKIEEGKSFAQKTSGNVLIIGPQVKTDLFGEEDALGKKVSIGPETFEVIGVFGKVKASSIFGNQFDSLAVMPFDTGIKLNKGRTVINRIVIKAASGKDVAEIKKQVKETILKEHKGEENFSVLTQDDILGLLDDFLGLVTTMVSAIASISLVVGGIGIMNIMLVTVTERTKEIGLRKAVGATRTNIAGQFLIEAIMVTMVGGLLGLGISIGVAAIVAAKTALTPAVTYSTVLMALGISTVIGIIFGLWPALRAANKDPIEALRYE